MQQHKKGLRMKVEYEVKDGTKTISRGIILADSINHAKKQVVQKIVSHRFSNGMSMTLNGEKVIDNIGNTFQSPAIKKLQGMPERPW